MIQLREHQTSTVNQAINAHINGLKNVCVVLPTGAGKTFVIAELTRIARQNCGVSIVFAHRDVLLGQISDALCVMQLHHSIYAAKKTVSDITTENQQNHGDSYFSETANIIVASVDTFIARMKKGQTEHLAKSVTNWFMDETHHVLAENKWGRCVSQFINAKGVGVTATPIRSDGKGLGRDFDGVFDELIVGSNMGELIKRGYLSTYKIYVPPTRLDVSNVKVTSSGDYNQKQLAKESDNSDITGDAVEHYLRICPGQQAITFCVNIEHSQHVADEFNRHGVNSVALSSKTPAAERARCIKDFKAGRITNLVNCDLFGEGFDVPAVVACIMLRKTKSYSLFKQQFGRALRVIDGKPHGILIDHVNNVPDMMAEYKLGHPHEDPVWTLERKSRRASSDDGSRPEGVVCVECSAYFIPANKSTVVCPECQHVETNEERLNREKDFQAKAGTLIELDTGFIDQVLAERAKVDTPMHVFAQRMQNAPSIVRHSSINNHAKRQHAQAQLRREIQEWCVTTANKKQWDVTLTQSEFKRVFGVNIFTAQTLSERESIQLTERIKNHAEM
ncbi:DEAD/DEAH box helicase [Pseudoalteromonas luteoviolacea]|uniref:DEAD/DEAH box helicase n=1 Tax=Pseudoalteromonas luteoviolacea TaxID=43657 RepID=UPI001B364DCA|nr:DEAD/DEAH box helicase [Pseudoalteromonas luteoviolacea]MBQ4838809.1 DEAD/DEAH box helicase [Pseudoalteromonas luteoviolacea]